MDDELIYLGNIKRTILVVDDEEVNREILGGILEDHYDVLYAKDGDEALQVINEKGPLLSLVLLDLIMPTMDGFAVMEEMQKDVIHRNIPIIVLTSEESAEIESLKKGAADLIKKPYDMPEKIIARVRRIIALFEDRMIIQSTEKDELTGLLTKSYFYEYASLQDKFYPGRKMDAVVVNINHFHLFNELYGMHEGDRVLITVAEAIRDYAETSDGIAGRCEGDVFFLYVTHRDSYEDLAEAIKNAVTHDFRIHNVQVRIGVNDSIEDDMRIEMAFERARMAGNTIRADYSRTIAYYDDKMRKQRMFEERLIQDIADGIARNQFIVLFQPKYDIREDEPRLVGAEALVRWNHPEFGLVAPDSFISLFEENGLIRLVDDFVWRTAA
ncbi:MAG: response regulator [Lachnospiraceae bacterium]|nr:response regulator [Lachnospiraceae bacterium]